MKKKSTVKIIEDLVASMQFEFSIKSVSDEGEGKYLVSTCNTHYLQSGPQIIIDGVSYEIMEVVLDESILIKGDTMPPVIDFNLPAVNFYHGTIMQLNTELSEIDDMRAKTPMVYLLRPFKEQRDALDLNNPEIERESNITLYFLTEANFEEWKTVDHDHHAIDPMESVAETFIDTLKSSSMIGRLTTYEFDDKIKFGVYISKGVEKGFFKDNLSGKELNMTLPISVQCCDDCC